MGDTASVAGLKNGWVKDRIMMPEQNEIFTSYDGLTLQGTYAFPDGEIKSTALLIHSGTASRYNGGFHPELAGKLLEIGVASLRFDYRGHGENTLPMEEITMYGVINDIDAAYEHLKKLESKDRSNGRSSWH